jgi:hypothetical protein
MLTVPQQPATAPANPDAMAPLVLQSQLTRLTTNTGEDIEPTVGPVVAEYQFARPNGQLAYVSNRDDNSTDDLGFPSSAAQAVIQNAFTQMNNVNGPDGPTATPFRLEDYDVYIQDLSVENTGSNRSTRIVDTPREYNQVLEFTGDTARYRIDSNDNADSVDDDYGVAIEIQGDERNPTFAPDGTSVVFATDSNVFRIYPGQDTGGVKDDNPNSDYDLNRVDINSRGLTDIQPDAPSRAYVSRTGPILDVGRITGVSHDVEPSWGGNPPADDSTTGSVQSFQTTVREPQTGEGSEKETNQAPVAEDGAFSTLRDTPVQTPLKASDGDGDQLTYTIRTKPSHGKLSGSGANRIYTPDPGFVGTDRFTFSVSDGKASSNVAEVTIRVRPSGG